MKAPCPRCEKEILDFKAVELPADFFDKKETKPWVLLPEIPCPGCKWRAGFGRFKSREEADAFRPPKALAA